jgi:transposase
MKKDEVRRQYTREFKMEAAGLVLRGDKPATVIARDLGIGVSLLYRWKGDYQADKDNSFPGSGHLQNPDDERVRADTARGLPQPCRPGSSSNIALPFSRHPVLLGTVYHSRHNVPHGSHIWQSL